MMAWRVARSLDVLLGQLNALAPNRSKVSDGGIGDAEHASRSSDHNPWFGPAADGKMLVTARDFTHDPAGGLDCNWLANALIASGDRRIKYIIWNRRIWTGGWKNYAGTNPHTKHLHVSVVASTAADSTAPWNLGGRNPGEFLMSLSDAEARFIYDRIRGFLRQRWFTINPDGTVKQADSQTPNAVAATALDSLDGDLLRRLAEAANAKATEASAKVDGMSLTIATAVQAAVRQYLAENPPTVQVDYVAFAKAVNDDADMRARDNDPATGPRS